MKYLVPKSGTLNSMALSSDRTGAIAVWTEGLAEKYSDVVEVDLKSRAVSINSHLLGIKTGDKSPPAMPEAPLELLVVPEAVPAAVPVVPKVGLFKRWFGI